MLLKTFCILAFSCKETKWHTTTILRVPEWKNIGWTRVTMMSGIVAWRWRGPKRFLWRHKDRRWTTWTSGELPCRWCQDLVRIGWRFGQVVWSRRRALEHGACSVAALCAGARMLECVQWHRRRLRPAQIDLIKYCIWIVKNAVVSSKIHYLYVTFHASERFEKLLQNFATHHCLKS